MLNNSCSKRSLSNRIVFGLCLFLHYSVASLDQSVSISNCSKHQSLGRGSWRSGVPRSTICNGNSDPLCATEQKERAKLVRREVSQETQAYCADRSAVHTCDNVQSPGQLFRSASTDPSASCDPACCLFRCNVHIIVPTFLEAQILIPRDSYYRLHCG